MGKLKWSALVVTLALGAVAFWPQHNKAAEGQGKSAQGPVPVVTASVAPTEFLDSVTSLGTAQANESVDISAKVSERITAIHFTEGAKVKAGTLLVELSGDEQLAALAEARVNLAEAQRKYQRLKDTPKATARTSIEESESLVRAAEAQVAVAEARVADRRISAPFSGVLGLRQVSVGDLVSPGALITTLDDLSIIKLYFSVPETFLAGIKPGQTVEARSDAYPDTPFTGKVSVVSPRIDPVTRAVAVRAELPNPDGKLKPGLLMTVTLIKNRTASLAVPESALVPLKDKQYVFVVDAGKVKRVEIDIGRRIPGKVEVLSGLSEGQIVVSEGTLRLRDGSAIATRQPGA